MQLSTNLPYEQMLTKWSSTLNPLLACPLTQGRALNNLFLPANTPTTFNHYLGRNQVGFFVTDINAAASVFRTQPFNGQTITLQSNADVTINLWVF